MNEIIPIVMNHANSMYLWYDVASLVGQTVKNPPVMQETQVQSLGWKDPLEKEMATHSSILAGEFHGQRSLVNYSPRHHKELGTTEWLILLYDVKKLALYLRFSFLQNA